VEWRGWLAVGGSVAFIVACSLFAIILFWPG
jgi:hypothetical protein